MDFTLLINPVYAAQVPKVRKHGLSAYASGQCRCDICRKTWARYIRLRRRQQHARPASRRAARGRGRRSYYADKAVDVHVTRLGAQILLAAEKRSGLVLDDIVERLVREHGPAMAA